ncbi:MAG TPA: CbiX/SirB N-terminal domain-containing protein [Burkholderiales bacterium]|nr:CbiX/SirB N-terminal domain-containing protein [Burkholderiales bacterium]
MKEGIVLFAHGSRDPEWARPFERIASILSRNVLVRIAYLELMRPSLDEAVASLAAAGARSIRIVPLFLGQGGHVKEDLPRLVAQAGGAHPEVKLVLEKPIGEQPAVIEAIAEAIAAGSPSPRGSGPRS